MYGDHWPKSKALGIAADILIQLREWKAGYLPQLDKTVTDVGLAEMWQRARANANDLEGIRTAVSGIMDFAKTDYAPSYDIETIWTAAEAACKGCADEIEALMGKPAVDEIVATDRKDRVVKATFTPSQTADIRAAVDSLPESRQVR